MLVPVSGHKTGGTTPGKQPDCINSAIQQFGPYVVRMAKVGRQRPRQGSPEADPSVTRNVHTTRHKDRNHKKDAKPDPPTPKSSSVDPAANSMEHNRNVHNGGTGHDSSLESSLPAPASHQSPVTSPSPRRGSALCQLELQHELDRVQMQLQFEQERREWAQHEAVLLRDQLTRYRGTAEGNTPRQLGQSDDEQGVTRHRQSANLVYQTHAVDETDPNNGAGREPNRQNYFGQA